MLSPLRAHEDDPALWLGGTELIDPEDPKLRLRVRALTQLCKGEREKAVAVYAFVKRMPLSHSIKLRTRTARAVLDAGRGDANDKATLLVAMLRLAGVPARPRYLRLRGQVLRGLTSRSRDPIRPLLEAFVDGRWLRTDTYIFDAGYMAAARQRLKDVGWDWGYGIHVRGAAVWDARDHAFVNSRPSAEDPLVLRDYGVYHDPSDFATSPPYREHHRPLARMLHWNLLSPEMQRAIKRLREGPGSAR